MEHKQTAHSTMTMIRATIATRHSTLAFLLFTVGTLILWTTTKRLFQNAEVSMAGPVSTQISNSLHDHNQDNGENLSVRPGELPGYTGWARPERTMASYYRITTSGTMSDGPIRVGSEWRTVIQCTGHPDCRKGGAHFYVRLYGPSVLVANVEDHRNGSYAIQAWPAETGLYTIEIVLCFSGAPDWNEFPLYNTSEPAYEGYLLPDFPRFVRVLVDNPILRPSSQQRNHRTCTLHDLVQRGPLSDGPRTGGRWVVVNRTVDSSFSPIVVSPARTNDYDLDISLGGYQNGNNALGIWMEYRPRTCALVPWPLRDKNWYDSLHQCGWAIDSHPKRDKEYDDTSTTTPPLHVIFIGDSVMRLQHTVFSQLVTTDSEAAAVQVTLISTHGGIVRTLSNVIRELTAILQSAPSTQRRFLLFNTGLHDIAKLCSQKWSSTRRTYLEMSDEHFSCTDAYRSSLGKLFDFIHTYPAALKVFQTTTAGWPKYGNVAVAWPPHQAQPFPLSPNFCHYMNSIALDLLSQYRDPQNSLKNIFIMDGYWMTLARPDNREIDKENAIGKHLVHPGKEVVESMAHVWWNLMLSSSSSSDCRK